MKIKLANPRGFCAGVDRAIEIVKRALDVFGAPIYVRHEVVHNRFVVKELTRKGVVFVEELDEVPDDKIVIFSAHGVSKAVQNEAKQRGLKVFDATCPLVTKVHMEVIKCSKEQKECILIGHKGHPEVEGTLGQYEKRIASDLSHNFNNSHNPEGAIYLVEDIEDVEKLTVNNPENLFYVSQTTLSIDDCASVIDALKKRFPAITGPKTDDICYATQNRQDAVKKLAQENDLLLVVGSVNSSNSNRLKELAERVGCEAYLIDSAQDIDPKWLEGKESIGISAGASAPEILVQNVVKHLEKLGARQTVEVKGQTESIHFSLPVELRGQD